MQLQNQSAQSTDAVREDDNFLYCDGAACAAAVTSEYGLYASHLGKCILRSARSFPDLETVMRFMRDNAPRQKREEWTRGWDERSMAAEQKRFATYYFFARQYLHAREHTSPYFGLS